MKNLKISDCRFQYDDIGDTLEVFFGENESATGIELTDHIILRVNQNKQQPVSLTILDFSILTEQTEFGPRSFPLNTMENLPDDLHDLAIRLINTTPVNHFIKVSKFQSSPTNWVPLTYVEAQPELITA